MPAFTKSRLGYSPLLLTIVSVSGAFITYFSMYAFRKPFTAAEYESIEL
jgi:hypothetical protein